MFLLALASVACLVSAREPFCRLGEPEASCKITGEGCDEVPVTFNPLNLTVMKWDKTTKKYDPKPFGQLEAHVAVGGETDWQCYLHGPMLRPWSEQGNYSIPPFYVSATLTNKVYRFEQVKNEGGIGNRGKPMRGVQKVVAQANAPSTAFPIEDSQNTLQGLLVAEGQPFGMVSNDHKLELDYGGVDYISNNCTRIFPNSVDKSTASQKKGLVTNTVDCHPYTGICFFSVWKFYDDTKMYNKKNADCLHYCVTDGLGNVGQGCTKAGIVKDENGELICSKPGIGGVHGFTIASGENLVHKDPNEFDVFLVFTGGMEFVGGESSMKKVTCKKDANGDLTVVKSQPFGRDLFEASVNRTSPTGNAPVDVGGDHAWVDESGKSVWVSTFRTENAGVHMLDYETGDLIYSVHGTATYLKKNYAYSAGIHGSGSLGSPKGTLLLATSACTHPKTACMPVPWNAATKMLGLAATGLMYIIDLSELLPPPADPAKQSAETPIII